MVMLMRHRQTKGPVSARPHLNRRATPRLHQACAVCSPWPWLYSFRNRKSWPGSQCNRDVSTTIKLADNSNMTDPNSDPPETLAEAAETFRKFLSAQHWPETIRWLTHDNVLVDGQDQFWVRECGTKALEHAKVRYSEGVERNLGVALSRSSSRNERGTT
jgi:hypothetical protein